MNRVVNHPSSQFQLIPVTPVLRYQHSLSLSKENLVRNDSIAQAPEEIKHVKRASYFPVGVRQGISDLLMFEHTALEDKVHK